MTLGVWEIRVCGYDADRPKHQRSVGYTLVARDYPEASAQAKRLGELDGLLQPMVWAATRLRDAPDSDAPPTLRAVTRPKYLTDSRPLGGPKGKT